MVIAWYIKTLCSICQTKPSGGKTLTERLQRYFAFEDCVVEHPEKQGRQGQLKIPGVRDNMCLWPHAIGGVSLEPTLAVGNKMGSGDVVPRFTPDVTKEPHCANPSSVQLSDEQLIKFRQMTTFMDPKFMIRRASPCSRNNFCET